MSKSGQAFVAATEGSQSTLYAACKALGIPLSEEQEEFQSYLERTYPTNIINHEVDEEQAREVKQEMRQD